MAELPNDELEGLELGATVWVDLRKAKAFRTPAESPGALPAP